MISNYELWRFKEKLKVAQSLTCDQGPFTEYAREAFHVIEIVLCSSYDSARRDAAITSSACEEDSNFEF